MWEIEATLGAPIHHHSRDSNIGTRAHRSRASTSFASPANSAILPSMACFILVLWRAGRLIYTPWLANLRSTTCCHLLPHQANHHGLHLSSTNKAVQCPQEIRTSLPSSNRLFKRTRAPHLRSITTASSISSTMAPTTTNNQQPPAPEKKIVDEVSGWLRIFEDGTVDRTWTGPPEVLPMMQSVPPTGGVPNEHGVIIHDVPGNPTVRLYLPELDSATSDKPLPLFIHFHGGGFCISHVSWFMYHHFYVRFAREIPCAIVSVEMPLAPENRLPAAFDSSYRALIWASSLARGEHTVDDPLVKRLRSSVDFSRVYLIGDSTGANQVHELGSRAGKEEEGFWEPMRIAGGILLNPGFVRAEKSRSETELPPDAMLTQDMLEKLLSLGRPEGSPRDHPYTCPMGEAAPPLESLKLPPFLVGVAELDLLRDTDLEYYEAMKAAGKDVELLYSEGVGHSFYLNKFALDTDPLTAKRTDELLDAIKSFIDRHK